MPEAAAKIALACTGVGLVQRGFERLFRDLYDTVSEEHPTVIYKGGGAKSSIEKIPLFLPRGGNFLKFIPIHKVVGRSAMHVESATFALSILGDLKAGKVELLHTIDPPLTRFLFNLRKKMNLPFKLLYTEGTAMPPRDYPPADYIHQMSKQTYDEALAYGYREDRMKLLPLGIHSARFQESISREKIRQEHNIPADTFVIACVAALNRYHKRTHYVIDEVATMEGKVLLWLDGSLDHGDQDIPDYARKVLGNRVKITRVKSEEVGQVYRAADIKVLGSSFEAFGLVIPEAMVCGTPILVHNTPHFEWLVPFPECRIDMMAEGALSRRLTELRQDRNLLSSLAHPSEMEERYDWRNLTKEYLTLYQHVLSLPKISEHSNLLKTS